MQATRELLKSVFGFDSFRPGQEEIVAAIMPTGGGKSLCYQLPALRREGLTVVISPLIALMRDQVAALREAGVEAGALTSANDPWETERVFGAREARRLRLFYMAPERLASEATLPLECHPAGRRRGVSQWGHDFRPDYLRIGAGVQTAAFTATADADTRAEIAARLFAGPPEEFIRGFDRPNLHLAFEPKRSSTAPRAGRPRRWPPTASRRWPAMRASTPRPAATARTASPTRTGW